MVAVAFVAFWDWTKSGTDDSWPEKKTGGGFV
jgi:hypothetical protein